MRWWVLFTILNCTCCTQQAVISEEDNTPNPVVFCSGPAQLPDLAQLGTPRQWTGIGNSHLPITTSHPEAQARFDEGVNLLHSFHHLEAYRVFQEVVKLDPDCAMGYWGMAMCQPGFVSEDYRRWEDAIDKAIARQGPCKDYEKELIAALYTTVYRGTDAATQQWDAVLRKHFYTQPDVVAFAAIILMELIPNETVAATFRTMLEAARAAYPDHVGLGHYYVHFMEESASFALAKPVAERLVELAPAAAHLAHMPGHLYFLEGNYAQAAVTFERAQQLESAYHEQEKLPLASNQNYFHNLHYLALTYAELNQYEQALAAAQAYANITLRQPTPLTGNALFILYRGRILPAWVHIRFRHYEKAVKYIEFWLNHPAMPIENETVRTYLHSIQVFSRGMAAVEAGKTEVARLHAQQLEQLISQYEEQGRSKPARLEVDNLQQTYEIMQLALLELKGWLDNIDASQTFDDQAWQSAQAMEAAMPYQEPPRLMYPVAESKARLHLHRGDAEAASDAISQALQQRPNSHTISGLQQ